MSTGGTLFWAAIIVAGVAWLAPNLDLARRPGIAPRVEVPSSNVADARPTGDGGGRHALTRSADGHFYAEAQVNGAAIRFLVDTGASVVALTPQDARRAGIEVGDERTVARGAGGEIAVAPVVIDRIELGSIDRSDVRAVVAEALPVSLLGQSFLGSVDRVEIRDDRMTLR